MPVFYSPLPDMQTSLGGSVFTNNRTADGDFTREQEDTSGWLAVTFCSVDGGGRASSRVLFLIVVHFVRKSKWFCTSASNKAPQRLLV